MRNKGSFNRRTGKTTPRHKAKTHWGGSVKRKASSAKPAKAGAAGAAKAK